MILQLCFMGDVYSQCGQQNCLPFLWFLYLCDLIWSADVVRSKIGQTSQSTCSWTMDSCFCSTEPLAFFFLGFLIGFKSKSLISSAFEIPTKCSSSNSILISGSNSPPFSWANNAVAFMWFCIACSVKTCESRLLNSHSGQQYLRKADASDTSHGLYPRSRTTL